MTDAAPGGVRLAPVNGTPPVSDTFAPTDAGPVLAAGAVVWRASPGGVDVLIVHRPRYDDWSFPKGKLDPDEHLLAAAVREVAEETGVTSRLGPPLPRQQYDLHSGRSKRVYYWAARPVETPHEHGTDGADGDRPGAHEAAEAAETVEAVEVDEVAWVGLDEARHRLTYARDVDVLDAFAVVPYRSSPLIVLRHTQALARGSWTGDDRDRPLTPAGEAQARALVPLLQAYGPGRVVSSDAERCVATVQPYADAAGLRVEVDHRLSEEGAEGTAVADRTAALAGGDNALVVCSHRPVLPSILRSLAVHDPALAPGDFLVVHRQGERVSATEHHRP
jgi:8-oxo-(d)GTP phosphatase